MIRLPRPYGLVLLLPLGACGSEPVREEQRSLPTAAAAPEDPAAQLAADPARLKELRHRCRIDRQAVGDAACAAAARAMRMRFMGEVPAEGAAGR